jgi:hypothetical protein
VKSKLPEDGKPLAFILYSDKIKLSTFGSAKAYPIVARLANLPVKIRNSNNTMGGGQIVGWLPIVCFSIITHQLGTQLFYYQIKESEKDRNKPGFVNFKNAVWHESFYKLLESLITYSKTGFWFKCSDDVVCLLFPIVLILSADYEEQ